MPTYNMSTYKHYGVLGLIDPNSLEHENTVKAKGSNVVYLFSGELVSTETFRRDDRPSGPNDPIPADVILQARTLSSAKSASGIDGRKHLEPTPDLSPLPQGPSL